MQNSLEGKGEVKSLRFRISMWNKERETTLPFPREWELTECRMEGHNLSSLSGEQIRKAFENPIGSPRIRDLAKGKEKVVILFDDLARPTPVYKILPFVLQELEKGGVDRDNISLVCAYGCHRPLVRGEMIKKLGRRAVETYPVFNHNVYEHHLKVGTTSWGTPVYINREVAGADLKIGIGCLIPHFTAGYGGGAKILVPGAAGIETIAHNHINLHRAYPEKVGLGKVRQNPRRLDVEEAARIAGLDIIVNVVVNHKKQILGAFVGDFVEAHRKGVAFANRVYGTKNLGLFDLLVLNTFPIEESPEKAFWAAEQSLKKDGDVVLIWQNSDGLLPHYLVGTFGRDFGGRKWQKPGSLKIANARKVFLYTKNLSRQERSWWGSEDKVVWCREWNHLIDTLRRYHGSGTQVGIYPYATLQCPVFPDGY
jgi:nickel-dependent lactate racemase